MTAGAEHGIAALGVCHSFADPLQAAPTSVISIRIENLTKRFGESVALHSLNLTIGAGEIFFLLGPSGCGKTTLLRSVAGFYPPDEGRIFFGEQDVTRLPPHERNTGMMFQSYALWPHMTVAQNVAFGLEERRVPRAETARSVAAALDSVKMGSYASRKINQLSGGQQQRVALARAMVIRPRCLLLDEPLSNLDTKLRIEMRGEIRRICKEAGLTAIYVTHDQKEALSVGDRIAVMEAGHIRQTGAPAEVYRQPVSRFVADFMGEMNFLEGAAAETGAGPVAVATPLGRFTATAHGWNPAVGQKVLLGIRPEALTIHTQAPATNAIPGSIRERVYLGEMAQYRFAAGDRVLKVFELNPRFAFGSDGRALFASADPADIVVLPE
jgi:iron(III) transport system ATP-binding protein